MARSASKSSGTLRIRIGKRLSERGFRHRSMSPPPVPDSVCRCHFLRMIHPIPTESVEIRQSPIVLVCLQSLDNIEVHASTLPQERKPWLLLTAPPNQQDNCRCYWLRQLPTCQQAFGSLGPGPPVGQEPLPVVDPGPGPVGAGGDAGPATDAQAVVDGHGLPASVLADLHRADCNALMTIHALFVGYRHNW